VLLFLSFSQHCSAIEPFFLDWRGNHRIESFFSSQFINWTVPEWMKVSTAFVRQDFYGKRQADLLSLFGNGNLQSLRDISSETVVQFSSNRGVTFRMFDNPFFKRTLFDMGLSPDTAFGCAFNFLFQPNLEMLNRLFFEELKYLQDPFLTKIGIQIRVGDWQLLNPSLQNSAVPENALGGKVGDIECFFRCAEQIERERSPHNRTVWFFISDSMVVRKIAKQRYGAKLITKLDGIIEHVQDGNKNGDLGFAYAAAELWLFGLTDYQVISSTSSFGRVGALRSMQWHSLYTIRNGCRNCGRYEYDSMETITRDFVQI